MCDLYLMEIIYIFLAYVSDGDYLHILSLCIEPSAPLRVQSTDFAKGQDLALLLCIHPGKYSGPSCYLSP
jgi:hypothetical protein